MNTNRRIMIDNATLSGVERLIGVSRIINLSYIDNDILCFEKLITAILFSDQLIGVDDYKKTYRSNRLKQFDFVDFIKMEDDHYTACASDAAEFARRLSFSFDASKPTGDVVSFFESLRIDPQLRWDVWVSSEYLTLSYLVKDAKSINYEQAIDSAFRNEATDESLVSTEFGHAPRVTVDDSSGVAEAKDLVRAFADSNERYSGEDGKSALDRLIFGYGWVAERSHFYNAIASELHADVFLAPLRDAFCESCLRMDYPAQVTGLLQSLKEESQRTLAAIFSPSGQAQFALRLPFFTAYLISQTDHPKQCIDLALQLRDNSEFRECRTIFHNMMHLSSSDKTKEINGILRYLEQSCQKLMSRYAVSTSGGLQVSLSVGLAGIGIGLDGKLNQLFRRYKNEPFARVFRNIAQDMVNVERLGGLRDKLCSEIRPHEEATYPKIQATPKFMEHRQNEYGRPAKLKE